MKLKDYYAILGVARGADRATIIRACRQLMQRYHPDHNSDPGAAGLFREVCEAGRVLRDAAQRAVFDRMLAGRGLAGSGHHSGACAIYRRGCDIHVEAFLSTAELLTGVTLALMVRQHWLRIRVPPQARAGQSLRIRERGLPRRGGGRGDLLLVLRAVHEPAADGMNHAPGSGARKGRIIDLRC